MRLITVTTRKEEATQSHRDHTDDDLARDLSLFPFWDQYSTLSLYVVFIKANNTKSYFEAARSLREIIKKINVWLSG